MTEGGALLPASGTATTGQGYNSQPLDSVTSAYNSGTASAQNQEFQWLAEPVGNNTSSPSGKLDLLFGANGATPTETGLSVANNGQITFATGQTFPGVGTVTSVGSGAGLTGGPITGSGTLSIATGGVTNAMLANPSLTVTAGTDLTGGGAVALGGSTTLNLDTSKVPQLNTANTFTGNQTVNGNLSATGAVTGSSYNIGSNQFAFGSYTNHNAFLGFAGNTTTTGRYNSASGFTALSSNTTGDYNTASGSLALYFNTTGTTNTADGFQALYFNTTGGLNTASGLEALLSNTTGSNNTASGSAALSSNTTGTWNTAAGDNALLNNTTGYFNTASGSYALQFNTTGAYMTALGYGAGPDSKSPNLIYATAIGAGSVVSQNNALVLGGTLGSGSDVNVGIGTATPSNVFTIAQNAGHAIADGWDTYSSRRWKTNIQTLHGALGKVEQLRGVSYDLKANGKHEVGVIAEEVGAVVPEVVSYEANGKDARGVDYSRLTALLIEATKEQQREFRQEQAQLAKALRQIKQQRSLLRAQASAVRSLEAEVRETRETLRKVKTQIAAAQPTLVAVR